MSEMSTVCVPIASHNVVIHPTAFKCSQGFGYIGKSTLPQYYIFSTYTAFSECTGLMSELKCLLSNRVTILNNNDTFHF